MSSFTKESERAGRWVPQGIGDASSAAFIPAPLPPIPPIQVDSLLQRRLEAAGLALGVQSNLTVYDYLKKKIAIRIPETAAACGTTKPTVKRAIDDLLQLGIVAEITGKPRNKVYVYREYLDILNQDDDNLSAISTI